MQYREFGRTGWQVSEIGFGAWQIGGTWGKVDDDESVRTLLHAFEHGVNFVDTAQLYGSGHSEEVIGTALREWRGGKVYVATKAQPTIWPHPEDEAPFSVAVSLNGICAKASRTPCGVLALKESICSSCTVGPRAVIANSTGWRRSTSFGSKEKSTRLASHCEITDQTRVSLQPS